MTSESILYYNIHTCNSRVTLHDVTSLTSPHLTSPLYVVKSGFMWLKVALCHQKWFYVVESGFMWFYVSKSGFTY